MDKIMIEIFDKYVGGPLYNILGFLAITFHIPEDSFLARKMMLFAPIYYWDPPIYFYMPLVYIPLFLLIALMIYIFRKKRKIFVKSLILSIFVYIAYVLLLPDFDII